MIVCNKSSPAPGFVLCKKLFVSRVQLHKDFFFSQQEERIMGKTQITPNIWSRIWLCNLLDIMHKSLKSHENNRLLFCECFKRL